MNRKQKWLSLLLCLAMLLSWLPGIYIPTDAEPAAQAESPFQIHFIDVGQADAALIICDGEAMLIDGGNAADSQIMYTYLQKQNIKHLEYVIGTHAHEDHIGGIPGALQYVDSIGTVYCPVTSYTGSAFPKFVTAVQNHGKSIQVPTVGTVFNLGSAVCKIIAVNTPSDDVNDSSIVMRITYGENSFLFTGDAELPVETLLLNSNEILKSDVLKVGHHGSSSSTSYLWLRTVDPDYAVICVGADNSYGHPTEAVLSRLRDADVTTYRTDLHGDILCVSDGKNITFTTSSSADDPFGGIGDNSTVAPSDPKQIVDQAYSLGANESLPYTATLTGTITRIDTPFSAADNNIITVTMVVTGRENYPIQCYKMSGPGAETLKVGDVITVVGTIKNYVSSSGYSTIEFYFPSLIACQTDPHITFPESISSTPATSVTTGTAYKLVLNRNGTKYYFTGKTDSASYYLASSTNPAEAVTVYLEGTADNYRMYFMDSGVKTYIRLYERSSGKPNLGLTTTAPTERYRFDTTLKTLVYTRSSNYSYYMGTYSSYTNFRASNISYVTGANASDVDISQFPARLYAVDTRANEVAQWSVTLKDNIGINFQMNFTEEILADANAWVSIVFCNEEITIPVSQAKNGIQFDIAASQMTEEIAICTFAGNGKRFKSGIYSVKSYADHILSRNYSGELTNLVKEMLNYGAMAQLYFDYNTQYLANDGITGVGNVQMPEDVENYTVSGNANDLQFCAASLVYQDNIGLRYYFSGDVTGCTFTANGIPYDPISKGSLNYIEIADIMPQNLAQAITLTITDSEGNTLSVTYNPMNYLQRMYKKDNLNLKNLLQALYNYHLAAKVYTESE